MRYLLFSLLVSTSLLGGLWNPKIGEQAPEPVIDEEIEETNNCCIAPRPMRFSARYTTPRGIGYRQGYTTLEGFFSQVYRGSWVPFLDARVHIFDNGRPAVNGGLGCRYLATNRVWGLNAYYDYRKTSHGHYNQVAAGIESLGRVWDFRLNGYLPVGKKHGHFRDAEFKAFSEHHMLIKAKRNFALAGANGEIGLHVDRFKSAPLYFNAGPYYLRSRKMTTWGGQVRGAVDLFDRYVRLEGNVSYDHFFKWIGQAQVSINLPFGRRISMRESDCCETTLYTRGLQRVDRFEIIPDAKIQQSFPAIDPVTGQPYFFVFVNNLSPLSSSNGTFENPFPTLLLAQNNSSPRDVLYVFPGDGTSNGLNGGITLKDSQLFLGAATPQVLVTPVGDIVIPPQAPIMPVLTRNSGNIITLANNNLVSGFYFENIGVFPPPAIAIMGNNITNFTCLNNTFIGTLNGGLQLGVVLTNFSGLATIMNNLFSELNIGAGDTAYILVNGNSPCSLTVSNNTFAAQTTASTPASVVNFFLGGNVAVGTIEIDNNNFIGYGLGSAVLINLFQNASISNLIVNNSNFNSWGNGINIILTQNTAIRNVSITNNNFNVSTLNGISITGAGAGGSIGNLNVSNCNFIANNVSILSDRIITNGSITNNQFTGGGSGGLQLSSRGTSLMAILDNLFTGLTTGGPPGYAAQITTLAGSNLCLDFFQNITNPTQIGGNAPYVFNATAGTFNKTDRSIQENNIGTIQTIGTIGTCSIAP